MVECKTCETIYDSRKYTSCPKCQQVKDFEDGPWRYNNGT